MPFPSILRITIAAALCQSSHAAVTLASYTFDNGSGAATSGPSSNDPAVTASPFGGQTGISTGFYAYRFTQTPAPYQMQFTVTAAAGSLLDLSTISFSYDFLQSGGAVVDLNTTFSLYYSLNNFANSVLIQTFGDSSGTALTTSSPGPAFNPSSALSLSGVPDTNSISFRFVFTQPDTPLNTSNYRWAIDNVLVTGDVVPEPSALLLVAAGACLPLGIRRRQA